MRHCTNRTQDGGVLFQSASLSQTLENVSPHIADACVSVRFVRAVRVRYDHQHPRCRLHGKYPVSDHTPACTL